MFYFLKISIFFPHLYGEHIYLLPPSSVTMILVWSVCYFFLFLYIDAPSSLIIDRATRTILLKPLSEVDYVIQDHIYHIFGQEPTRWNTVFQPLPLQSDLVLLWNNHMTLHWVLWIHHTSCHGIFANSISSI